MHRDHLALEVGRELAHDDADIGELALDLVAIGLALEGLVEIEETAIPGRNLDGLVAIPLGPARDTFECVVRRRVPRELRQKKPWAFEGPHDASFPWNGSRHPGTRPASAKGFFLRMIAAPCPLSIRASVDGWGISPASGHAPGRTMLCSRKKVIAPEPAS